MIGEIFEWHVEKLGLFAVIFLITEALILATGFAILVMSIEQLWLQITVFIIPAIATIYELNSTRRRIMKQ